MGFRWGWSEVPGVLALSVLLSSRCAAFSGGAQVGQGHPREVWASVLAPTLATHWEHSPSCLKFKEKFLGPTR